HRLTLQLREFLLRRFELRLGLLRLREERRGVLPLCFRLADFLGGAVALGLRLLDLDLDFLPARLEALELLAVESARSAGGEAAGDLFGRLAEELDIDHVL